MKKSTKLKPFDPDRDLSGHQLLRYHHNLKMMAYHEAGHALVASKLGASADPRIWLNWLKVKHPRKTKRGWFYGDTGNSLTATEKRGVKRRRLSGVFLTRRSKLERAAIAWGGPIARYRVEFCGNKESAQRMDPWTQPGRDFFLSWSDAERIGTDRKLSREAYELAARIIDDNRDELRRIAQRLMRIQETERMHTFIVPPDPYALRAQHWPPLRRGKLPARR